jgi:hypothetical protein
MGPRSIRGENAMPIFNMFKQRLGAVFLAALLALTGACSATATERPVIAVGDLHGDYEAYFAIIREAGLVDEKGRWTGGDAIFVQTGDIPDRGPDTRRIIEHMMKLEKAAKRKGGEVVALIGNHEAMNVTGDLRYVTPEEYAAFATSKSKKLRDAYFKANAVELAAFYRGKDPALSDEGVRAAFEKEAPLGYLEHRAHWSVTGKFGKWVAVHDAMRVVGDTLFVHGGVSAAVAARPLAETNAAIRAALNSGDKGLLEDETNPLWHRGNAEETPAGEAEVAAALAAFKVKRIVIGHTPQLSGIKSLYGGRVIAIDTGASAAYGGVRSFLRIDANGLTANDGGVERALSAAP